MKSEVLKKLEVVLYLDEEEAYFLKGLVQNYLGGKLENEPQRHQSIRMCFWKALDNAGVEL